MAGKKGTLRVIADAVGDAVQAVAAGVGLTSDPEVAGADTKTQPKSARKAARKAAVERAERAATKDRRAARRRVGR